MLFEVSPVEFGTDSKAPGTCPVYITLLGEVITAVQYYWSLKTI